MSKSCRSKEEYDRYHAVLTFFPNLRTTISVLRHNCIHVIKRMKCNIRAREHKLAIKPHVAGTSPTPSFQTYCTWQFVAFGCLNLEEYLLGIPSCPILSTPKTVRLGSTNKLCLCWKLKQVNLLGMT